VSPIFRRNIPLPVPIIREFLTAAAQALPIFSAAKIQKIPIRIPMPSNVLSLSSLKQLKELKTQETKMLTSAFDPKGDSRQPCVRSELEALPGLLGLYEKIATSSTPSNPLAARPELFPVSQSATDAANRRTIGLPGSKSADRCRSSEAADAAAAAQPTAAADKGFPRLAAPLV
jgi:hypothetical protein